MKKNIYDTEYCEHSVMKPAMDKLETCMDAYAGEMGKYDFKNKDIELCINILRNNLEKIEFKMETDNSRMEE